MSYLDDEDMLGNDEFFKMEHTDFKKVALYIMDGSGNVEDILLDLDEIRKYIDKIYATYPTTD